MKNNLAIAISAVFIFALVLLLGRRFHLSSRYERTPKTLNSWSALDKGIDPSEQAPQ